MSTQVMAAMYERSDKLRGTLLLSIILHGAVFVVVVTYTMWHIRVGGGGQTWGANDVTRMGAVTSLPGIPLPTPMVTTSSQVATENTGLHKTEPEPKEEPPPEAQEIPKFKEAVKPEKLERVNKRIHKTEEPPPDNAIPFGETGAPRMDYTQVVMSGGAGGISAGQDNAFGQRYAYYVAAMRNRISANWLMSMVSPNIVSAPRAYLTFDIQRDGTITNVQITQSSGTPEVDRSALRAILASNPLPPLPGDYSGSSVSVQFYFDFHR
jgi:periplasmic protein TonB